MRPYYQDNHCTLYHGDCLEILPSIEIRPSLVFTSPPYNKNLKYKGYIDDREDFQPWIGSVLKACLEITVPDCRAYFVVSEQMLYWMKPLAESIGWTYGQLLTWCKPNLVGGADKRITGDWNTLSEWILLFRKGTRGPMLKDAEGCTFNWFVETCPQSTFNGDHFRQHIAQMPLKLVQRIIRRTPGDVILEPFCGSGTTLLAAKRIGRTAIGIDVDESALDIAAKRLEQDSFAFSEPAEKLNDTLPLNV